MKELKTQIQEALLGFAGGSLAENAKKLLNVLGYESDRTLHLQPNNYKGFADYFVQSNSTFDPEKAKTKDWKTVDIIFQLAEDDIRKSHSLFEAKKVDNTIIESYLFFAVALTGEKYTRGDLVKITREINRLTPMPSMILFRHNNYLTIAVIDRRLHKRESSKDVLEKVTLIKDINIEKPHRAHIEILHDFSMHNLIDQYSVSNFVDLHNAWRKTLDISALNKKFYRELANWYFWAIQNVEFPDDTEKNRDVRNATSVIRLITRLMFVWFVKEKGLISDDLFNEQRLRQIIKFTDGNKGAYYKAILQNLFFATLNTEMNKDKPDSRKFRGKRQSGGRDQHYMIHNVFRYADYFIQPEATLKQYYDGIPFLNGGLFECLDKEISPTLAKGGEGGFEKSVDARLRHLVAYNEKAHQFTPAEVDVLIDAINKLKVLDPACGSGAFPMGFLHKLVYILGKLDPDNSKWRELQRQKAIKETEEAYKIGDKEERAKLLLDINEVFENNASDYGRKLYLIENCIYGVDIQPIAVQIAKLRFFISLIVDQHITPLKPNTVHLRIIGHEFCHSRNDSERESGLNCLKNHIPDRGIRG